MNFFHSLSVCAGFAVRKFTCLIYLPFFTAVFFTAVLSFDSNHAYSMSADCALSSQCNPPSSLRQSKNKLVLQVADRGDAALLRNVPLETMIGQMFMLSFNGIKPKDSGSRDARQVLSRGLIGGLIFMGHNMRSKAQITRLVASMKRSVSPKSPPFLAIDQEGGQVQRLQSKHGFTTIPTAHSIALDQSTRSAFKTYKVMAKELHQAGFNMNFGPVVDLNLVPKNPIIGMKERSYGAAATTVQSFSRAFVMAHRQSNILTALKHFPGHGSSWTDSHEQFVDLSASWKQRELDPYKLMINDHLADMIMVGHLYHPAFSDGDKIPASLSRRAIEGVLRGRFGYKGLVVTDDLGMGAIRKYFSFQEALIRAINAGNDIILIVDGKYANPHEMMRIHGIIIDAVKRNLIPLRTIQQSYLRIIKAKTRLQAFDKK